jgi:hypothetical protein
MSVLSTLLEAGDRGTRDTRQTSVQRPSPRSVDVIPHPEFGRREQSERQIERTSKTSLGDSARQVLGAATDFARAYIELREANTHRADKYFHCRANCEAAARGEVGAELSETISNTRETVDHLKNQARGMSAQRSFEDCLDDTKANDLGREAGMKFDTEHEGRSRREYCRDACESRRPGTLDEKY